MGLCRPWKTGSRPDPPKPPKRKTEREADEGKGLGAGKDENGQSGENDSFPAGRRGSGPGNKGRRNE